MKIYIYSICFPGQSVICLHTRSHYVPLTGLVLHSQVGHELIADLLSQLSKCWDYKYIAADEGLLGHLKWGSP